MELGEIVDDIEQGIETGVQQLDDWGYEAEEEVERWGHEFEDTLEKYGSEIEDEAERWWDELESEVQRWGQELGGWFEENPEITSMIVAVIGAYTGGAGWAAAGSTFTNAGIKYFSDKTGWGVQEQKEKFGEARRRLRSKDALTKKEAAALGAINQHLNKLNSAREDQIEDMRVDSKTQEWMAENRAAQLQGQAREWQNLVFISVGLIGAWWLL